MKRRSLRALHFKSEADLVACARDWLVADGWDVFLEVAPWGAGAPRADIVATRGQLLAVAECKLSMSLALLSQCENWMRHAHLIWAVTPPLRGDGFARTVATRFGFGVATIRPPTDYRHGGEVYPGRVETVVEPAFRRRIDPLLRAHLHEASRNIAPGSAHGFVTPFQLTCESLRQRVRQDNGRVAVKAAIESLQHHYSSTACARASLISRVEAGVVPGLRVEREGRQVFFAEQAHARKESGER